MFDKGSADDVYHSSISKSPDWAEIALGYPSLLTGIEFIPWLNKVIGLAFAGDQGEDAQGNSTEGTIGVGCRIDRIASILNLEAWDGTSKNTDQQSDLSVEYINGLDADVSKTINGKKYWQVGISA